METSLHRRDFLVSTAVGVATFDFSQSCIAAPPTEQTLTPELKQEFEKLKDFAQGRADLLHAIAILDELYAPATDGKREDWQSLKASIQQLVTLSENSIVDALDQQLWQKTTIAENHILIDQQYVMLQKQTARLSQLISNTPKQIAAKKEEVTESVPQRASENVPQREGRPRGLQITIASPIEEALQATGILDTSAALLDRTLREKVFPKLEELLESNDTFSSNKNPWRARLTLKQQTRPQDVLPHVWFDHLLNSYDVQQVGVVIQKLSKESIPSPGDQPPESNVEPSRTPAAPEEQSLEEGFTAVFATTGSNRIAQLRELTTALLKGKAHLQQEKLLLRLQLQNQN